MKYLALIAFGLLMFSRPVWAQNSFTGNTLQVLCSSEATQDVCNSYILGFMHGLFAQQASAGTICLPKGSTAFQAIQVIEKYMRDHPEHLNDDAWLTAAVALAVAFPCPKSN